MIKKDETLRNLLARHAVLPIMTIRSEGAGLRIAESLLAGGLTIMEITLRTAEGAAAIAAIRRRFPEMAVGAGTLLRAAGERRDRRADQERAREAVSDADGTARTAWSPGGPSSKCGRHASSS